MTPAPASTPALRARRPAPAPGAGALRERILRHIAAAPPAPASPDEPVRRVTIPLPGIPFHPALLDSAPWYPRVFWRGRDQNDTAYAAAGALLSAPLAALAALLSRARPEIRAFGAARFSPPPPPDTAAGGWDAFPAELWFVPRVELAADASGGILLSLHTAAHDKPGALAATAAAAADWLETAAAPVGAATSAPAPRALSRRDTPRFDQWSDTVSAALALMRRGSLRKVVPARRSRLELDRPPAPFAFAARLAAASPCCFHFCLEPAPGAGAFLGATPELLFRRRGSLVESEAVAGTRPRSLDPAEDERLGACLLAGPKEREEHALVVTAVSAALAGLCETVLPDPAPGLLRLARVQHLRTRFTARLRAGVTDAAVLAALHPTPATCGLPARDALAFLRQAEPFDRGWFAGPVGAAARDSAELAVAIRSMRLNGRLLDLFAGAGIVPGSDPEAEWAELESKISGPLRLLDS